MSTLGFKLIATLRESGIAFEHPNHARSLSRRVLKAVKATELRVMVTVEKYVKQRTLPQNAYLHAHPFPILAKHFGCSVSEVKRDLMGECFGWKQSPITHREVPAREHTADMNVEDCNFFIDWLLPWALTEHGVELDPPDPEWMFNQPDVKEEKPKRRHAA